MEALGAGERDELLGEDVAGQGAGGDDGWPTLGELPDLTAGENVSLPLLLDGVPDSEAKPRVARALERLGIGGLDERHPEELSGGEMLRVAVARALVIEPLILLADEPTGSLDRTNSLRVVELLRDLHRQDGVTIVLVTHDSEVASAADSKLGLADGRLAEATTGPRT